MAALNFPTSPLNGDTFTSNGRTYTYSSAAGAWKASYNNTSVLSASQITTGTFSDSLIPSLAISKITNLQTTLDGKANIAGDTFTGNIILNAQSDIRFADSDSSHWIALQSPATVASNVTLTLPNADGTAGNVLFTNGSGTLGWRRAISYTASATAPAGAYQGDEWWDTDDGSFWKYINDGTTSQWVEWGPNNSMNGQELITGNLIPNANVAYSLGSSSFQMANIFGTIATAAQPSITSFGNIATANIGNISSSTTNGNVTITPNGTGSVVMTANVLPNVNAIYNLGSTSLRFNNIWGVSSSALYADLAENYQADDEYPIGTVMMIGGDQEITIATELSNKLVGTISEKPGFLMNDGLTGKHVYPIAYIGRVPCRVMGKIHRGDLLVVGPVPGVAIAEAYTMEASIGNCVGKALQDYDSDSEGMIEILVGRL
jgi:hypothetical protein